MQDALFCVGLVWGRLDTILTFTLVVVGLVWLLVILLGFTVVYFGLGYVRFGCLWVFWC